MSMQGNPYTVSFFENPSPQDVRHGGALSKHICTVHDIVASNEVTAVAKAVLAKQAELAKCEMDRIEVRARPSS